MASGVDVDVGVDAFGEGRVVVADDRRDDPARHAGLGEEGDRRVSGIVQSDIPDPGGRQERLPAGHHMTAAAPSLRAVGS